MENCIYNGNNGLWHEGIISKTALDLNPMRFYLNLYTIFIPPPALLTPFLCYISYDGIKRRGYHHVGAVS